MINTLFGFKHEMSHLFDDQGKYIPVTCLFIPANTITQIKTKETKDGYHAVQIAMGKKKYPTKAILGHIKKSKVETPRFIREIRLDKPLKELKVGQVFSLADIFNLGDHVKITGTSKGRGFTGVIKRWGFHGGPRTHGQSDRRRAPGSIGQGTDPGRVWKGKKMPGRFGGHTITTRGLKVMKIDSEKNLIWISGDVPGARNSFVRLTITKKAEK